MKGKQSTIGIQTESPHFRWTLSEAWHDGLECDSRDGLIVPSENDSMSKGPEA